MDDLIMQNVDNEWTVGAAPDGQGYRYTASHIGVLWASGWVRCSTEDDARGIALGVGRIAMECAS